MTSVKPSPGLPFVRENIISVEREASSRFQGRILRTPAFLNPVLVGRVVDNPTKWFLERKFHFQKGDPLLRLDATVTQRSSVLDTFLSDPPCRQAAVYQHLSYTTISHLWPPHTMYVLITHGPLMLEVQTGITLRDIFQALSRLRGHARVQWPSAIEDSEDVTTHEILEGLRSRGILPPSCVLEPDREVGVSLFDVVIPTDWEWTTVTPYVEEGAE